MDKKTLEKYITKLPFKIKKRKEFQDSLEITFDVPGNAIEVRRTLHDSLEKLLGRKKYMEVYPAVDGYGKVNFTIENKIAKIAKEIVAMTERNEMFKCKVCRNVIRVMRSGSGNLECCDKPMIELRREIY